MSTTNNRADTPFTAELLAELRQLWTDFAFNLSGLGVWLRNALRGLRRLQTDFVVIPLSGSLPERSGPPRGFLQRRLPLPSRPLSIERLNGQCRAISDAGNANGVVFIFQGLSIGLATAQTLRRTIERLRAAGKEVVVFTPYLDLTHYYTAAAANRIIVPPSARFEMVGLRVESVFFKDALDRIGIQADVIQISPFKTAYNELGESQITPEQEQQLNWILDDAYEQITGSIAADRALALAEVQALIDAAPLSAGAAQSAGLIDDIAYEDELATLLADSKIVPASEQPSETTPAEPAETTASAKQRPRPRARLTTWPEARAILMEKRRRPAHKYIGVVSLEGNIMMGASRSSPLPIPLFSGRTSGEQTLSNLLRRAEKDRRMAALVLHVDSGGGSALASDLIWRQLQRIAVRLPVVTYMGNTAASGGYYVAASSRRIISQPLTLTGSIGVVTVHISTKGLFEKLDVNRVLLQRGERANLSSDFAPLTKEERQVLWVEINDSYQRFLEIVSTGRNLERQSLDEICEGRVWTGRQARERGLVDDHGDLLDAVVVAAQLADLVIDDENEVPVYNFYPSGSTQVLPKPFEEPAALLEILSADQLLQYARKPLFVLPVEIKLR